TTTTSTTASFNDATNYDNNNDGDASCMSLKLPCTQPIAKSSSSPPLKSFKEQGTQVNGKIEGRTFLSQNAFNKYVKSMVDENIQYS
ncbi:hypothetical protein, partial [Staphylococcus aureus]|uniref:hypothetical protein n=1 Tax=Staphylococcus aureus TaxID=1280 RepID=UPI001E3AA7C9